MRQEPIVYVNGNPVCARPPNKIGEYAELGNVTRKFLFLYCLYIKQHQHILDKKFAVIKNMNRLFNAKEINRKVESITCENGISITCQK